MKIIPILDNIFIEPALQKTETDSGIVLSREGEKPTTGTVIVVGPGKFGKEGKIVPPSVKMGDKVIFKKKIVSA